MPDDIKPHHHTLDIAMCIGGSRCLGEGTPILMHDGSVKAVEAIQKGDLLMGPDSKPRRVVSLTQGEDRLFEVKPTKGEPFVCNGDHILTLKTSGLRVKSYGSGKTRKDISETGTLREMTVFDFLKLSGRKKEAHKLYRADPVEFPPQEDLRIDPYYLGIWLGDGTARNTAITTPDQEVIDSVYDTAAKHGLRVRIESKGTKADTYHIASTNDGYAGNNSLRNAFKSYGLLGNKHIPQRFLCASQSDRLQLLAGLLDADGHLSRKWFEITQKNELLANQIVFLARSLGFASYIKPVRKSCVYKGERRWGTYFKVSIIGDVDRIPNRVPRKKSDARLISQSAMVTGLTIKELPRGKYFGFQLAGTDKRFLAGDFTVLHNSGKSVGAVARALYLCRTYPNAKIIVGSVNFTHLEDTIMEDYKAVLSIHKDWDHPFVQRGPNRTRKRIEFKNGSRIRFVNLDDNNYKKILGQGADFVHIDEPELLKTSGPLEYCLTRLSSTAVPFKQVVLTANPTEDLGWAIDWFKLHQFDPSYQGPPLPIGEKCKCHLCVKCEHKQEEVLYLDGVCPSCGHKKDNVCPGDQHFIRVLFFSPEDNEYLRDGYQRDLNATLSHDRRVQFSQGIIIHRTKGKPYTSWDRECVFKENIPIDPNKDLIWSLDFNQYPQCSIIAQEYKEEGVKKVVVLDELIRWGAGPEKVAREFVAAYKDVGLQGSVHIYGDPSGFTRQIDSLNNVTDRFRTIVGILEKEGFDVILHARPTVYSIIGRIDSVNWMLKDGNSFRRMKINPKCQYLIKSAESTNWNRAGKKEDENEDTKARAKGRDNDGIVWALTHPMCALGYYIIEEHPMNKRDGSVPFVQNIGTGVVSELREGEIVEYDFAKEKLVENEQLEIELDEELSEELLQEEEDYMNESFASHLRRTGNWIGQSERPAFLPDIT